MIQEKASLRWANSYLIEVGLTYTHIQDMFTDGWGILALIELLAEREVFADCIFLKKPEMHIQKKSNLYEMVQMLVENFQFDLLFNTEGFFRNSDQCYSLVWQLINRGQHNMVFQDNFEIVTLQTKDYQKKLLSWVQTALSYYELSVENFTECANDQVLAALVHYVAPASIPYREMVFSPETRNENLVLIFDVAKNVMKINSPFTGVEFEEMEEIKIRKFLKDLAALYGDWENTQKYFTIGAWIDAIEKREKRRRKMDQCKYPVFPLDIWMLVFSHFTANELYSMMTISRGFLFLVNCKVPIALSEFAKIKQDFDICNRYKSGFVSKERLKKRHAKRNPKIVKRWQTAVSLSKITPTRIGASSADLLNWKSYLNCYVEVLIPARADVIAAFQEIENIPVPFQQIVATKFQPHHREWMMQQYKNKEEYKSTALWIGSIYNFYFTDIEIK